MGIHQLDRVVRSLFAQGIAQSTARAYKSGVTRYINFCHTFILNPFPLSEPTLCRFVAYLSQSGLSHTTIQLYLSALHYQQISQGGLDPSISSLPHLHYVVRGIRKSQPAHTRPRRLPITPAILHTLYSTWTQTPSYNTITLWAACCLGFFAFMRSGEFTCPSWDAYVPSMLSPADVQVDNHNHSYTSAK